MASVCLLSACGEETVSSDTVESEDTASYQTYSNVALDAGFDTVLSYTEQTDSKEVFDEHFEEVTSLFTYYNNLFDIYNDYEGVNNIKTINDNAGKEPVKVDSAIIELLEESRDFYELSNHEFDVTMGSLLKVWHTYRDAGIELNTDGELAPVPSYEELSEAAQYQGFDHVIINEEESTVYIDDENISLDVGGVAKGFATEQIALALEEAGVEHAVINAGGNNRTVGSKIDGSTWNVGIQNPGGEGSLFVLHVNGTNSFVTSGDYERYFVGEDNKIYHHIIDPSTLYPATNFHSVTIITRDSGKADCFSTTLFTLSYEEGIALVDAWNTEHPDEQVEAVYIADKDTDMECMHETSNYCVAYTSGLEGAITWAE